MPDTGRASHPRYRQGHLVGDDVITGILDHAGQIGDPDALAEIHVRLLGPQIDRRAGNAGHLF
jgi:hypothetical protein